MIASSNSQPRTRDNEAALRELSELHGMILQSPSFRPDELQGNSRKLLWLGSLIKEARLSFFGAEFAARLALVSFALRRGASDEVVIDSLWHGYDVPHEWSIFIHFLDPVGGISFQGDFGLGCLSGADMLGFRTASRKVQIPADVARGLYRIRLGVWSPVQGNHISLTRCRGLSREAPGWCENAVFLTDLQV